MNIPLMNEKGNLSREIYCKKISKWKVLELKHKSNKISLPSLNSRIQSTEKKVSEL